MREIGRFRIKADEDSLTVWSLLRRRGASRGLIRRLRQRGRVLSATDGRVRSMKEVVREGDEIVLLLDDRPHGAVEPEPIPLQIVHEDQDLLVIDKPAGMLVHPVHGEPRGSLAAGVAHHLLAHGIQGRVRPVHRLDRDTSGLVVWAKNPLAHHALAQQLARRELRRAYLALVAGWPPTDEGTVDAPIGQATDPSRGPAWRSLARVVDPGGGRPAVTQYRVLAAWTREFRCALLELELGTGRTHQIRVHLAHLGCPVLSDWLYGDDQALAVGRAFGLARQALHAWRQSLVHPRADELRSSERLTWLSPLPPDMRAAVRRLNGLAMAHAAP